MTDTTRFVLATILGLAIASRITAEVPRPDLRVNAVYLAKWTPPPVTEYERMTGSVFSGTKVFLVCEVLNGGTAKVTGNYFVSFRIDGVEVGSQLIENAPDPGFLRKPGAAWTPEAFGSHVFQCSVDPFPSRQVESDEQNNERSLTFKAKARKLPMQLPHQARGSEIPGNNP